MGSSNIAREIGLTTGGIPELSLPTWRVLEAMTQQPLSLRLVGYAALGICDARARWGGLIRTISLVA